MRESRFSSPLSDSTESLAYSVEQRFRKIGVRVALGADKREIFRFIIGVGMRLALVGAAIAFQRRWH
ncbi:MAG: hypothetical protein J2P21_27820 [Chloracidobacterium sp.]|nr:hypothetical protein [Chloracidobacterium sp.]